MGSPGEVSQEIGRAYVHVLTAALQTAIRPFRAQFTVLRSPTKLSFTGPDANFSFDVRGIYGGAVPSDVFVECKGRSFGSDLGGAFREFIVKSYALSSLAEHSVDRFWFVTNVPFNCQLGRKTVTADQILTELSQAAKGKDPLLRGLDVTTRAAKSLADRMMVGILTDTLIRSMGLVHYVEEDESIWSITKSFYADRFPSPVQDSFEAYAESVARLNQLADPNLIYPGLRLRVPWFGIDES